MLPDRSPISKTPESLYCEKYTWLLRWAQHFCGKDKSAAEDLVQDVFMQMLISWPTVAAAEEPEKLLYTYLKYAFLLKCRRDRRHSFQTLSAIDFESVQLSLARQGDADPIEMQDGLRRILAYLNWRKLHAKCASILLLRFFHGFFPSEIMQIALQTRRSVDAGLAQAREEAKSYLADPTKVSFIHRGSPRVAASIEAALPPDELISALRTAVFDECPGHCLSESILRKRYLAAESTPIECDLLAHIVSCPRCLDLVCRLCRLTPLKDRSPEEAWGFAKRDKSATAVLAASGARRMQHSIAGGEQRYRAAYEHRPKALLIAVDGQLLASRDVSCFSSELKIELTSGVPTELIEIMSEQELPLLTVPFTSMHDNHPTCMVHESMLAGGQCVTLTIRFFSGGVRLELHYLDPFFEHGAGELRRMEPASIMPLAPLSLPGANMPWSRLPGKLARLKQIFRREASPFGGYGFASLVLLLLCVAGAVWERRHAEPSVEAMLDKVAAARRPAKSSDGVVVQQLRIVSSQGAITRVLHSDVRGRRRANPSAISEAQQPYAHRLALAAISWEEPLSAANFRDWHDHAKGVKDDVRHSGAGELTLTSQVNDLYLVSESLTVSEADFHPISRSLEFRDHERIEIAEVNYQVIPWAKAEPQWFEAEPSKTLSSDSRPQRSVVLERSSPLTDFQLDQAELEVRLGLSDARADTSERLKLTRERDGIHVEGLVANEGRKREIVSRLARVPHAVVLIRTFAEFEQQPGTSLVPSIISVRQQETGPSPLEQLITSRGGSAQDAGNIAHALFAANSSAQQAAHMLDELNRRFQAKTLTDAGVSALHHLRVKEIEQLNDSVNRQIAVMVALGVQVKTPVAPSPAGGEGLREQAARNTQLCTELISQTAQPDRGPDAILTDLATSLSLLKFTAEQHDAEEARSNDAVSQLGQTGRDH